MWVTKLLISLVEIRIFCPKTTKFGQKFAFLFILGQACWLIWCPVGGLVGGCGARAGSRKTPIYFIKRRNKYILTDMTNNIRIFFELVSTRSGVRLRIWKPLAEETARPCLE